MNNKKILLTGVFVLFGIILLSMNVSATAHAVTLNTPAASANISGTYLLNATLNINNGTTGLNLTRAWFVADYNNGTNVTIASFVGNVTDVGFNTSWNSALAPDSKSTVYNITFWVIVASGNGTTFAETNTSDTSVAVIIDNSAPTIFLLDYVNGTLKDNTANLTLNISVVDMNITNGIACRVSVDGITNQSINITVINATYGTCNSTNISLSGLGDGNHTIKVYAGKNTTYYSSNLFGQLITYTIFTDTEGSAVELTASSITKDTIMLIIDTSAGLGSGISSCTADRANAVVTTTSLVESGLNCGTIYTYVVTCTDSNSHTGTATESFSTNGCGGTSTSGTTTARPITSAVAEAKVGTPSIVKYSDATLGIKQISIEVNNNAQNVQVTVTKEAGKPAAVSVAKSGKVYQYLHIETKNLADKLSKATVQFKVQKSWVTTNNVNKDNIVVSKFDETANKWNVLTTTYDSEDSSYYYYDVEVSSFSYFAISEKSSVAGADEEGETATTGSSLTWLWIVLAVVVVVVIGFFLRRKK